MSKRQKKKKIYSEYDIACFLVDYTGLDYRALPEEDIYDYLEINEMYSSNTSFTNVQESEIMPSAIWDSPDGMMTITTNYTYLETLNNGLDSYKVYAMATWLEYPRFRLNDCLTIGHNAYYDDDIEVTGKVTFEIYCDLCDLNRYEVCEVDTTNQEDGFTELKFQTMAPSLHFDLPNDKCEECLFEQDVYFVAFLRYGILADTVANIQTGYAHKLVGVGKPSVGMDINGTPSFGVTAGMQIEEYIAEPVTVMID